MSLPSPSSLGRVAADVRSETLERVEEVTEPASLGTTAHRFLANVLLAEGDVEAAMVKESPSDREWLAGIDVKRLPAFHPELYGAEISFAYNPKTGRARELGRNLTREQARALATSEEMVGTADVAGIAPEGVVVLDYKTGYGWVDPPSINWQVLTYALMAARAWDKDEAVVGIVRARADGYVWTDTFHVDLFRLEQHELELRALLARRERVIEDAKAGRPLPPFVEGPHCQYCPGRRVCPPKTAQLLALAAERAPVVETIHRDGAPPVEYAVEMSRVLPEFPPRLARLSDENAVLAWERLKFAEKMVERLKAEVREYARRNPLSLGGGWVLAERQKATEKVVAELAVPLLEQAFGPELGQVVAGACVETSSTMTKAALTTALSRYVLPTLPKKDAKISWVKESVLQRFREGGAISVRVGRNVEEHKVEAPEESRPLTEGEANGEGHNASQIG